MTAQVQRKCVCDVCSREEIEMRNDHDRGDFCPGWWALQATNDRARYFVRLICPACWDLLFVRLFPQTAPPPPIVPKPNPGVDLLRSFHSRHNPGLQKGEAPWHDADAAP